VNQRVNGGQFYLLGTYTFYADSGGAIRIRNDATDGYVIADAVMLTRV
ncbi:carbohydrate-binding protein, partial [Methanofollis fontis]